MQIVEPPQALVQVIFFCQIGDLLLPTAMPSSIHPNRPSRKASLQSQREEDSATLMTLHIFMVSWQLFGGI